VLGNESKRRHYDETGQEPNLDSVEVQARKSLLNFVNQALEQVDENADFVGAVCMQLELNRQKFAGEKHKFERLLKSVAAHKRRLKRKKRGANMFLGVFEEKRRTLKCQFENASLTLRCIERGIEMMQDYESVFEEAAAQRALNSPTLLIIGTGF